MGKRLEFSRKVKRQIIERAGGCCERCSAKLKAGEGEVDHILPSELGGEATPSNGQLLCRPCHREKTTRDVRMIRKSDRMRDKHTGAMKRKSSFGPPHLKKKISGEVVDTRTGEVVGR
ncbi:HNH endonuclease [Nitratireductor sp. CH_MIT9313-5]|uniref:HNH endonuclease n=1 Tax=Nitratireductor sp. CH_MIT9313-5 TaxID=3107764 RepID=UPI00300B7AE5